MTTLAPPPSGSSAAWGSREPRFSSVPPAAASLGDAAVNFAADAGLILDPWQQDVLRGSLGVLPGGKWAARSVGLLVPRQNGKGAVLEARELFGMFVLKEPLIIHSAHKFDTSQEHFGRMRILIDGNRDLARHVKSIYTANGKESIELRDGCRLKFKARTISGSGRGFSCDCLVLDEAMILPEIALAAMLPTQGPRPNPQTWYTSSSGLPDSTALWRVVKRGRAEAKRLAYYEWGSELGADPADPAVWLASNPAIGYRLNLDEFEEEQQSMTAEDFAREHLGIWDEQADGSPFGEGVWDRLEAVVDIAGPPTFALEVAEDRSWSCVAAAGRSSDGTMVVDAAEYRPGVDWVVGRLAELARRRRESSVVVQPTSAAGALIADLMAARVRVVQAKAVDYAQACGTFYDLVVSGGLRHLGQPHLDVSVAGARQKPSSEAWVWDRRRSGLDISPLVAATLAVWGASQPPARGGRFMSF